MPRLSQLTLTIALLAQLGCTQAPTDPGTGLLATAIPAGLQLTNRTSGPVVYFVISVNALAFTEFVLCDDPTKCGEPKLLPGETVTLPWTTIRDYRGPGEDFDVMWTYGPRQYYTSRIQSR